MELFIQPSKLKESEIVYLFIKVGFFWLTHLSYMYILNDFHIIQKQKFDLHLRVKFKIDV